jgi:pilus assembly protein CpaD
MRNDTMTSRFSLLLLAGAATLGACASVEPPKGPPIATGADRHRITVEESGARMEVPVVAEELSLSPKAREDLSAFAGDYLRGGHGALIMSTPSGGDNADAAALLAHQTRLALVDSGVPYAAIAGSTYDASGAPAAPIVLTFIAYEARPPECAPLYTQDLAHQSNNQAWESFGCSTQANLAALVEDPHDLLAPRNEDPRDSGRRATVFGAYRAGEATHATRSPDERVAVSNAVD